MSSLKEEKRRQLILDVYNQSSLSQNGFKYLKSKSMISKKIEDLNFYIGFGSSPRSNTLDNVNVLIAHVGVEDKEFAKWKEKELNMYPDGLIASSKIKNIFTPGPPYYSFDIKEDDTSREKVVNELIDLIENDVYKLFDICSDIEIVIENINMPSFSPSNIILYLAYLDKKNRIDEIIKLKQSKYPEIEEQIKLYYQHLRDETMNKDIRKETYKAEFKSLAFTMAKSLNMIKYW